MKRQQKMLINLSFNRQNQQRFISKRNNKIQTQFKTQPNQIRQNNESQSQYQQNHTDTDLTAQERQKKLKQRVKQLQSLFQRQKQKSFELQKRNQQLMDMLVSASQSSVQRNQQFIQQIQRKIYNFKAINQLSSTRINNQCHKKQQNYQSKSKQNTNVFRPESSISKANYSPLRLKQQKKSYSKDFNKLKNDNSYINKNRTRQNEIIQNWKQNAYKQNINNLNSSNNFNSHFRQQKQQRKRNLIEFNQKKDYFSKDLKKDNSCKNIKTNQKDSFQKSNLTNKQRQMQIFSKIQSKIKMF